MLCKPKFRVVMLSEEEYNVLKRALERLELGDIAETETFRNLRAALVANIHAVKHGDEYIAGMADVLWTKDCFVHPGGAQDERIVRVRDLFNLYDAIFALTETSVRDDRLRTELTSSMVTRLLSRGKVGVDR